MLPSSNLFVKVTVKKRPYSQEPLMLYIGASFDVNSNYSNSLYFRTLSLQNLTIQKIDTVANQLKELANAKNVYVTFSPTVNKYISQ